MKILAITEQREGKWNKASFETLAAAQQIAKDTNSTLSVAVVGNGIAALADELAGKNVAEVLLIEHELLGAYTPDGFSLALAQVISQGAFDLVLLPHTYQVRDFAPKLAASLGKGMIGDCIAYRNEGGKLIFVRQMFQGKTVADVSFAGTAPWFATFQAGAFRADLAAAHPSGKAPVQKNKCGFETGANSYQADGIIPRGKASGGFDASADSGVCGTRNQGAGKYSSCRKTCKTARRRNLGVASHLRRRLAAYGTANWKLGANCGAETLFSAGN